MKVTCTAKLGTASLRGTSRGKRLNVKILVSHGGATVSHSYTGPVRR